MPKPVHMILNVVRGVFLLVALGATGVAIADEGSGDQMIYLNIAVTAAVVSVSLAPRLWVPAAASTPAHPAPPGAPGHPQQAPAVAPPPSAAPPHQPQGQPQPPPAQGQPGAVYGGGTHQGQVYGQSPGGPATGQPGAGQQQPGAPDWQQRPGGQ